MLADEVVYQQKPYWCNSSARRLSLSFLGPRRHFPWDKPAPARPLIVFLCGGGFTSQDRNVWIPELTWFAKRGYAVAAVDYSTQPHTRWPEQIIEVKTAIRFLRAHAEEFHILPDKIAIMGESAGGYLASVAALTGEAGKWDVGDHLEVSSAVQAAVPWYPPADLGKLGSARAGQESFPALTKKVTPAAPPFLILHGTTDSMVPAEQGEMLYSALETAGVPADLILVEGADHSDEHFIQPQIKEEILAFLNKYLN